LRIQTDSMTVFLVVRMRGDVPRTLREQFFPSLKKALLEHPTTETVELPFWHAEAIKWLNSKTDDKHLNQIHEEQHTTCSYTTNMHT